MPGEEPRNDLKMGGVLRSGGCNGPWVWVVPMLMGHLPGGGKCSQRGKVGAGGHFSTAGR